MGSAVRKGDFDGRALSTVTGGAAGLAGGLAAPYAVAGATKALSSAAAPVMSRFHPENYTKKAIAEGVKRSGMSVDEVTSAIRQAQLDGQDVFAVNVAGYYVALDGVLKFSLETATKQIMQGSLGQGRSMKLVCAWQRNMQDITH